MTPELELTRGLVSVLHKYTCRRELHKLEKDLHELKELEDRLESSAESDSQSESAQITLTINDLSMSTQDFIAESLGYTSITELYQDYPCSKDQVICHVNLESFLEKSSQKSS